VTEQTMALLIALPEGAQYVAQDADGAYFAFGCRPHYDRESGEWTGLEPFESAHIGWGVPPFDASTTLRKAGS
jgi:hypothetical protein